MNDAVRVVPAYHIARYAYLQGSPTLYSNTTIITIKV
jgi:hypothetical protein